MWLTPIYLGALSPFKYDTNSITYNNRTATRTTTATKTTTEITISTTVATIETTLKITARAGTTTTEKGHHCSSPQERHLLYITRFNFVLK